MQIKGGTILGSTTAVQVHVFRALPRGRWIRVCVRRNTYGLAYKPDETALEYIEACVTVPLGPGKVYQVLLKRPNMPTLTATDFVEMFGGTN